MEKVRKVDVNGSYVIFYGEDIEEESYSVKMVEHRLLKGLLPGWVETLNQEKTWKCDCTGKKSLVDVCRKQNLGGDQIRWLFRGILENIQEMRGFLLDENCVLWDTAEVFLDEETNRVWNCYVPFYKGSVRNGLRGIAQFVLGHLSQDDTDAVSLAYQIFRYVNQEEYDIDGLWSLLEDKTTKIDALDGGIEKDFLEDGNHEVQMDVKQRNKKWSSPRFFVCVGAFAMGLFLLIYILWNAWYMSALAIAATLLLIGASVFGGIWIYRKWHDCFCRKNPFEEAAPQCSEVNIYDQQDEMYENWKETIVEKPDFGQTGEIGLDESIILENSELKSYGCLIQKESGTEYVLTENPTIVGKLADAVQICLDSPYVSRIHAKIWKEKDEVYVEDLNSKNGTYINEICLEPQKPTRIRENDELAFANITYYFQL